MYCELFTSLIYLALWFVFEQANFIKALLKPFYKFEKAFHYHRFESLEIFRRVNINSMYVKFKAGENDRNCQIIKFTCKQIATTKFVEIV